MALALTFRAALDCLDFPDFLRDVFAAGNNPGDFRPVVVLRRIYETNDSDFNSNDFRSFLGACSVEKAAEINTRE